MAPTFPSFSMATTPNLPLFSPKITKLPSRHRHTINLVTCTQQQQQQQLHWVSVDREVKTHILKSLPTDIHPEVEKPMRHLISSAPPTVAPAICLASCQLIGGDRGPGMTAACCMQLMHVALHVHRRLMGPTHSPQGNFPAGIELMTGDGILAFGYEIMSKKSEGVDASRVVRAIIEIANGVGPKGVLEVEGEKVKKEGRLSACASACGAIMGGGSDEEVERMRRVGFYAGMMMCAGSDEDDDRSSLLSMARLELQGFGEERLSEMERLMDMLMGQRSSLSFSV